MTHTTKLVDLKYDRIIIDDAQYKGVLFSFDDKSVWLPRSLIEIDTDSKEVTMPEWLAIDKELV